MAIEDNKMQHIYIPVLHITLLGEYSKQEAPVQLSETASNVWRVLNVLCAHITCFERIVTDVRGMAQLWQLIEPEVKDRITTIVIECM